MIRLEDASPYSGRIIIELSEAVVEHMIAWVDEEGPSAADKPYVRDLEEVAARLETENAKLGQNLREFVAAIDARGGARITRAMRSEVGSARALLDLDRRASKAGCPLHPSLLSYWIAEPPEGVHQGLSEAVAAGGFASVQGISRERRVAVPVPVNDPANELSVEQGYLRAGPEGIDAEAAWAAQSDGRGVRLGLVDVEWELGHPDLPAGRMNQVPGLPQADYIACREHGTRTLGVVAALDNGSIGPGSGAVGIAPMIDKIWLASFASAPSLEAGVVRAIARMTMPEKVQLRDLVLSRERRLFEGIVATAMPGRLRMGDVFLIEAQSCIEAGRYQPVEFTPVVRTAIAKAIAGAGIVVIEPAGNGGSNLDTLTPDGHVPTQAILVGSCLKPTAPVHSNSGPHESGHRPAAQGLCGAGGEVGQSMATNYGQIIDCYAWGECVTTCAACAGPLNLPGYTSDFGGTSAASAIIAGAAILVQQKAKAVGAALSSMDMKGILSDPTTATRACPVRDDHGTPIRIGVMPDLAAIIAKRFPGG